MACSRPQLSRRSSRGRRSVATSRAAHKASLLLSQQNGGSRFFASTQKPRFLVAFAPRNDNGFFRRKGSAYSICTKLRGTEPLGSACCGARQESKIDT